MSSGLVIVNTGDGKGKTTAALGMVLRAVGHGMRVLVVQFVKSATNTGELKALDGLERVTVEITGLGFLNDPKISLGTHREAAKKALALARDLLLTDEFGMVVLDEILLAVKEGLLNEGDVMDLIAIRPEQTHLVLTGRGCPESIMQAADTVTDMREVKHAYADGAAARPGVEF